MTGELEPRPEVPPQLVVTAYVLAAICLIAPLAVLGAGFAGAVLFTRGRRAVGASVIVLALACVAIGGLAR